MILFFFASCKNGNTGHSSATDEFKPSGHLADLVRSPVRPDGSVDSSFLAILHLQDTLFDFGTVNEGDVVIKEFAFTNTGTAPLLITEAKSTCGCTIPEWPKDIIQPGDSGVVLVKFNTLYRTGAQLKEVTIFANSFPNQTIVRLRGRVVKK